MESDILSSVSGVNHVRMNQILIEYLPVRLSDRKQTDRLFPVMTCNVTFTSNKALLFFSALKQDQYFADLCRRLLISLNPLLCQLVVYFRFSNQTCTNVLRKCKHRNRIWVSFKSRCKQVVKKKLDLGSESELGIKTLQKQTQQAQQQ